MKKSIVASNLTKIYTDGNIQVKAVSAVDLQLHEGEIVGLFGPSGSGKTTLLSLIGCILRPTKGSLNIYGIEATGLVETKLQEIRKRYLAFIFQGFNLFPALSAYENVMLALQVKKKMVREISVEQRIKGLFKEVGIADRIDFLPRDLSGGQKQRVSIARALATDAAIILADEPTANLDYTNGRKVIEILRRFAKEGNKCVVVATHDNRLEDVFDRILIMEDGAIVDQRKRGM